MDEEVGLTEMETEVEQETIEDGQSDVDIPESTEDEFYEVDYEGKQYKIPKELKDALLRQSDYTRKTQEVAEHRRQLEAAQRQFQMASQAQQQNLKAHAQLMALEDQIQRYQNVDFQKWMDEDPVEASKAYMSFNQLNGMREHLKQQISAHEQQRQFERQQNVARLIEEGQKVLKREIPNWSADTAKALKDYGQNLGFNDSELDQIHDPRIVKTLHKAYLYDQMMNKAKSQPVQDQPKPVTKVGTKAGSSKDPEKMTTEEWVKWRNQQLRRA